MAEALALIGLAAALVQFVDFGSKVVRQLRRLEGDAADMPTVLRNVRTRLPLMLDLVKKIMLQMDAGLVHRESQEVMLPVVQSCVSQAEQLDSLISKALPQSKESSWMRGKKAVIGVLVEPDIQRIDAALKADFDLLAQAGTFQSVSGPGASKSVASSTFNMSAPTVNVTLLQQEHHATQHTQLPWNKTKGTDSSSRPSIFMVPFPRDINFLGRNATLNSIDQKFEAQSCVALSGLGGIGKSQIAIEYCYIFKERHPEAHVFWTYGSSPTRFEQSYQEIARKLSLPCWDDQKVDSLQLVHDWLKDEESGRWLLIVDNADDASVFYGSKSDYHRGERDNSKCYARYLPNGPRGSVLVTTRDRRVGERLSGRQRPIDVTPMTATDSKELLRSKMSEEQWCEADAMTLVQELSYLPLAITQAAAFISENNLTVSEYLETLFAGDEDAKELLSEHLEDSRRDLDTDNSVMRTWKLSFDQISKGLPRAAEILSLLSVLDYHGAPLTLLRKDKDTETGFRTALGALQAFSLITAGRGKDAVCKMHRLVALSTQKWLELRGSLRHWQTEALNVLTGRFPGPGQQSFTDWAMYEALTPHTLLVFSVQFTTTSDLLQCAKLLVAVALYNLSKGRYAKAFEMCSRSLEIRQSLLSHDDPLTLDSVQTLGETLLHCGKLNSARSMLQRAATGREKMLGPDNPDTLESFSDLTICLLELDDVAAAEITSMRALKGRQQVLGEDDLDTLVSLNIMAILRQRQGDLAAAKELCETALKRRENKLGCEHPETLMTLNNLARLYYEQGDLEAAKQMFDRVLAGEEKLLGAEGYDIQVTLSNMALVLSAQGDLAGAEAVLRRVLEMRERLLGLEHSSTLFTVEMVAGVLKQKGELEAAERMDRMVSQRKERQPPVEEAGALLRAGLLFD